MGERPKEETIAKPVSGSIDDAIDVIEDAAPVAGAIVATAAVDAQSRYWRERHVRRRTAALSFLLGGAVGVGISAAIPSAREVTSRVSSSLDAFVNALPEVGAASLGAAVVYSASREMVGSRLTRGETIGALLAGAAGGIGVLEYYPFIVDVLKDFGWYSVGGVLGASLLAGHARYSAHRQGRRAGLGSIYSWLIVGASAGVGIQAALYKGLRTGLDFLVENHQVIEPWQVGIGAGAIVAGISFAASQRLRREAGSGIMLAYHSAERVASSARQYLREAAVATRHYGMLAARASASYAARQASRAMSTITPTREEAAQHNGRYLGRVMAGGGILAGVAAFLEPVYYAVLPSLSLGNVAGAAAAVATCIGVDEVARRIQQRKHP